MKITWVKCQLDGTRVVQLGKAEGSTDFFLDCVNAAGEETKLSFSEDAMDAIVAAYNVLETGV